MNGVEADRPAVKAWSLTAWARGGRRSEREEHELEKEECCETWERDVR